MRAATSAPATQWPRPAARRAAWMPSAVASAIVAPETPALTAAATAAAPASATPVLCDAARHHRTVDQGRQSDFGNGVMKGDRNGDAYRRDAHGGAIGGAGGAGLFRRHAGQDSGDGALGGGTEQ